MNSPIKNSCSTPARGTIKGKVFSQRGLSLIELMVSITLGLLILAALSTLFVNQTKTRTELDKANRMIDNGRYALEVLAGDLRLAGYYGEFAPTSSVPAVPASLPDPCSTSAADMAAALQLAVQGVDATTTTTPAFSTLCAAVATANSVTLKPGSDILVIRRASTATPLAQGFAANGTHYLQVSLCQYDTVASYKIDTIPANFNLRTKSCTPTSTTPYADLRQFVVHVYFVSPNNNPSPADGIPTLKRLELDPATHVFVVTPLVEGIEYMQIEYGLDTNDDGIPDSYKNAPVLAEWPNAVAVKLNIVARNNELSRGYYDTKTYSLGSAGSVGPLNDSFKRHAYTQFIRLVNPAGRREVP